MSPDIIIFDESTSMLDPQGKKSINEQIKNFMMKKYNRDLDHTWYGRSRSKPECDRSARRERKMSGTPMEIFKHEEELKKMQLDIPFALKFSNALQKKAYLIMESVL